MNKYDKYQPFNLPYGALQQAIQYEGKAAEIGQQRFDLAENLSDEVNDLFLKTKALPGIDTERRNLKVGEFQKELADTIEKYNGNYAAALPAIKQMAKKAKTELTYGELGAIHENYTKAMTALTESKKAVTEGIYNEIGHWNTIEDPLSNWQGTNFNNGKYNQFSERATGKYSDISKELSDFAQQWAASTYGGGVLKADENGYYMSESLRRVDYNEVKDAVMRFAINNPKYEGQINDFVRYHNKFSPDETYDLETKKGIKKLTGGNAALFKFLEGVASPIAMRESFTEDKFDWRENWIWRDQLKHEREHPVSEQRVSYEETPAVDVNFGAGNNYSPSSLSLAKPIGTGKAMNLGTAQGTRKAVLEPYKNYVEAYKHMSASKQQGFMNLAKQVNPTLATKLASNAITPKEMETLKTEVDKIVVKASNIKVGAIFKTIPADQEFDHGQYGSKGLTMQTFHTDKLKEVSAGNFVNRKIYDPTTNTTYDGKDFYDKIVKEEQGKSENKDALITVTSESNGANPFVVLTGNKAFANASQITIGGKQYILGGPEAERIVQKDSYGRIKGYVDKTEVNETVNEIYNLRFFNNKTYSISPDNGKTVIKYSYNENTDKYKTIVKGEVIESKNAEDVLNEAFSKLKEQ